MIGGTAAVSDDIQAAIEGYFPETARLYGKDRYATSSAVANEFFKGTLDTVVIASGKDFPDGLAGGPVACAYKAPVVLVADGFYDHAKDFFAEHNAYRLIVMGGKGVISETTSEAIAYPATEE
jgi:putative cell wall-binding protein